MSELLLVALASALAGFIDSIVGGGGLVLTPALFAVYPQAAPATLLGTNKSASVWGTAWSFTQYARRVSLNWRTLWPAVAAALLAAFAGAWAVTQVSPAGLKRALPLILVAVFAYTLMRKDLGRTHRPRFVGRHEALAAAAVGAVVGFYDGFFGPGTGSFFVFLFVRVLGYDFLHASASAKLLNVGTNVAALVLFSAKGHVWWQVAPVLAAANVGGSLLGTRLALRHGAGFVRGVFIAVVGALILKTSFDALRL
ncbi:sulfite exporter TauE/SafE family protein [Azohydromonas aeria]|uniref:sulfite exporter TauE/SafE family protein n=1 Tax=Azohydromonas aeria TaxID=2590212 RepID=UPI0012FA1F81|nr:TSUP family transporter [Azohydromonas aeria]